MTEPASSSEDSQMQDLQKRLGVSISDRPLRLLPEPTPRPVWTPFISVDDHALEPADLFERYMPRGLRDRAPRVDMSSGRPRWIIEDKVFAVTGHDAAVGRPMEEWAQLEIGYDEMRSGVQDPHARLLDMDLIGAWASLCFPSITWGFAGKIFSQMKDSEAGLAAMRAYNDWMLDEWCGADPDRFITCQVPWLADPLVAAAEVRRNAERGFQCVSFSENPHGLGFTSLYSGEWDPFFAACEETGTVVNLHVGSSGSIHQPSPETPVAAVTALFPLSGIEAIYDWIFARIPVRFPGLRIVTSEAGVTWVPLVLDRLEHVWKRRTSYADNWADTDPEPVDLVHRNFYFTSIHDPSAFHQLDIIGEDKVMLESDYPHADSSWPDSQSVFETSMGHLSPDVVSKISYRTAAKLYRHPEPSTEWLTGVGARFEGAGLVAHDQR